MGVGGIGIGLVSAIIALNGRIVKLEANDEHKQERLRRLESAVFKDHEMRLRDQEIKHGTRGHVRMHRQDDTEGTA